MNITDKKAKEMLSDRIERQSIDGVLNRQLLLETQNDILTIIRRSGSNDWLLELSGIIHDELACVDKTAKTKKLLDFLKGVDINGKS